MIEVIYKDESQEGQNGEEPFGLPRNIRQIGLAAEDYRIYMEDYVYTFLVRLARTEDSLGEAKTRVAVLTGNLKWRSQTAYLFIKGAIIAEEMEATPDHIDFSENQWKQIQEAQKEYFEDQEIVGWFFSQPQLLLKVSEVMSKVHMKHFGGEKVLMLMEPQEREDAFFRYENNEMVRLGGYYLYYEKNPAMQNYMINTRRMIGVTPCEMVEDRAAKNFRSAVREKMEYKEQKQNSRFVYAVSVLLVVIVLAIGISTMNNFDKMESVQETLEALSMSVDSAKAAEAESDELDVKDKEEGGKTAEAKQPVDEETDKQEVKETAKQEAKQEVQTMEGEFTEDDFYVVKKGDTLDTISLKIYGNTGHVEAICKMNGLSDGNLIFIGQKLLLP